MMSSCPTHSSGLCPIDLLSQMAILISRRRARRNARGDLEPDAPEDVVQSSLGFGDYELASRKASGSDDSSTSDIK